MTITMVNIDDIVAEFKEIDDQVLDWNKNAIDFYNKSGAKTLDDWRVVQMTKEDIKKHLDAL